MDLTPGDCSQCMDWTRVAKVFADAGHAAQRPATAPIIAGGIVDKSSDRLGFAAHSDRCVVEGFFVWVIGNRRLRKEPGSPFASAQAFLNAGAVRDLYSCEAANIWRPDKGRQFEKCGKAVAD